MITATISEQDHADRGALGELVAAEGGDVHEQGRHVRAGIVGPGHGEDEVEDLQADVPEDDHRREGDGRHEGKHDAHVQLPLTGPVHEGCLAQLHADPPQPREVQRHGVARHLPHRGDDDPDEREVEPVRLGELAGLIHVRPSVRAQPARRRAQPTATHARTRRRPRKALTATRTRASGHGEGGEHGKPVPVELPDLLPGGEPGELPGGRPTRAGSLLMPPLGCRSHRQIVPVTTKEREKGNRKMVLKNDSPFGL